MKDMRVALPALWIFMVLNYLYCDVLSLFDPAVLRDVVAGHASGGTVQITPEFLLASAVLMEIPMAMILLTRVLGHTLSRWANVACASALTSSGVTNSRPLSQAQARLVAISAVAPRGLAPRDSEGDCRVARAMSTM